MIGQISPTVHEEEQTSAGVRWMECCPFCFEWGQLSGLILSVLGQEAADVEGTVGFCLCLRRPTTCAALINLAGMAAEVTTRYIRLYHRL